MGEEKETNLTVFKKGVTCKCQPKEKALFPKTPMFYYKPFNEKLSKFSLLKVIKVLYRAKEGFKVEVKCECGNIHETSTRALMENKTTACMKCS